MADVKEDDEASKSNSIPKEDTTPMIPIPETVPTASKDEGNTMIVPEIDQEHNKKEDLTKFDAIKEDAVIQKDKEKMEEHVKVENVDVNVKGKGRNPRKRFKRKLPKITSEIVAANNGLLIEETHEGVSVQENNEDKEKLPESSNKRRRKLRWKKAARKGTDTLAVGEKNPESSTKKKGNLKTIDTMGMVFMCSSKTKADCFHYKILGLPAGKRDEVARVYKGMRLFLFDVELRLMYGIFKAVGDGGYNIEPKAFKSAFPSQVRFSVMEDCLPLAEENFRRIIKENYYSRNKFKCQLNSQQVKKLCKAFVPLKSGPSPKMAIKRHHQDARSTRKQKGREQKRRYHEYGGPPVYHVARYLPEEVGSYGYPVGEHRPYHVLDTDKYNRHQLYGGREAHTPVYRDDVYPEMVEYNEYHRQLAMLPHDGVSGGGLQVRGYGDVGPYFPSSFSSSRYRY